MESHWAGLLLLGAVATAHTLLLAPLSYKEAVTSAVDLHNEVEAPEFTFRLFKAEPQPDWKPSAETAQSFQFYIKETVCRSSQNPNINQCDFKENGVVKECSGSYTFQKKPSSVLTKVLCNIV